MDELDRKILDIIQTDFPVVPQPYAEIASKVGSSAEVVFERVSGMRKSGVIRQLSANFWANKLGFVSTLCGAQVSAEKFDAFIEMVNKCQYVTHNYLRAHKYNVWFTLICPTAEVAQKLLDDFSTQSGVQILNLPATKIYKINVNFKMQSDKSCN